MLVYQRFLEQLQIQCFEQRPFYVMFVSRFILYFITLFTVLSLDGNGDWFSMTTAFSVQASRLECRSNAVQFESGYLHAFSLSSLLFFSVCLSLPSPSNAAHILRRALSLEHGCLSVGHPWCLATDLFQEFCWRIRFLSLLRIFVDGSDFCLLSISRHFYRFQSRFLQTDRISVEISAQSIQFHRYLVIHDFRQ